MLDDDVVYQALGELGAVWPFTPETMEAYARRLRDLDNPEALFLAVADVLETHDGFRPTPAKIREAYRLRRRRQVMETKVLPSGERTVTAQRGREVAARAYVERCEFEGREPNWTVFDGLVGGSGHEPLDGSDRND